MFRDDILIKGKHASYLKFLSKKTEQNDSKQNVAAVFENNIDVYKAAIVMGLVKGVKKGVDSTNDDSTRMFAGKVIKEEFDLEYLFQMCMLIDNSTDLSNDEKIERAFKGKDAVDFKENLNLFNSYARGGIEWLYEEFIDGADTKAEYLTKIYDIVSNYRDENC